MMSSSSKRLSLVAAIESLTSVFRLADVDDWLGTVFILSEYLGDRVPSQLVCRQFAPRDEDRKY
jgi:hypothetical protein